MIRNKHLKQDEGQLFVLGAMLIAIILVSLAFSLNMVIYSENTAARGAAVAEQTAMDHQQVFPREISRLMDQYVESEISDRSTIEDEIQSSMDLIVKAERRRLASRNALLRVSYTTNFGILMAQDDFSRDYDAQDGTEDWTLVSNNVPLIQFQQKFDTSALYDVNGDPATQGLGGQTYHVEFEDPSGNVTNVYVYESLFYGDYRVEVNDSYCTVPDTESEIVIDYVENTVNGNTCSPLSFTDGTNWKISYELGSEAKGTYGLMVTATESDIATSNFHDAGGGNPFFHHSLTSVSYTTRYTDPDHTFITDGQVDSDLPSDLV